MASVESTLSPLGHPKGKADANGNWILTGTAGVQLKLAISKDTVDGAVLYTVPDDTRLLIEQAFWEVTTGFTGGTSSAVGLSSSQAPHDAAGDLLGGAGGDVAATLVAGLTQGTVGVSFSAAPKMVALEAGATIKYNRIASAFTAGAGFAHIVGRFIR